MIPTKRLQWETFLVRLWREQVNGAWRGEIIHATTRASLHFATFAQIESFITRFADGIENQNDSKEECDDHTE